MINNSVADNGGVAAAGMAAGMAAGEGAAGGVAAGGVAAGEGAGVALISSPSLNSP